jgi:hypothetical protein
MDIENQSTQIILTSIAIFLFFIIIVIVYRSNTKCHNNTNKNNNNNNSNNNSNNKQYKKKYKEKYEEVNPKLTPEDKEFLDKNVYQNKGLDKKDYEYLVNYPNGKWSCGEWSWGRNSNKNSNSNYSVTSNENNIFKDRSINSLFKF